MFKVDNIGIINAHCYAILDVVEVKVKPKDKNKARLIKLRNPWGLRGADNAGGAFKNSSNLWTKALKTACHNYTPKDDGIFWIQLGDFIKSFQGIEISRCFKDYYYTGLEYPGENNAGKCTTKMATMTVTQ